jgi:hypothetical protein
VEKQMWVYSIIKFDIGNESQLNEMGIQGWELVTIMAFANSYPSGFAYFKKRII